MKVHYSTFIWLEIPGGRVYFSYSTPVAAELKGRKVRRAMKFSVTTSRHLDKFCPVPPFELIDEDEWYRVVMPILGGPEPFFPAYELGERPKRPKRILEV